MGITDGVYSGKYCQCLLATRWADGNDQCYRCGKTISPHYADESPNKQAEGEVMLEKLRALVGEFEQTAAHHRVGSFDRAWRIARAGAYEHAAKRLRAVLDERLDKEPDTVGFEYGGFAVYATRHGDVGGSWLWEAVNGNTCLSGGRWTFGSPESADAAARNAIDCSIAEALGEQPDKELDALDVGVYCAPLHEHGGYWVGWHEWGAEGPPAVAGLYFSLVA